MYENIDCKYGLTDFCEKYGTRLGFIEINFQLLLIFLGLLIISGILFYIIFHKKIKESINFEKEMIFGEYYSQYKEQTEK